MKNISLKNLIQKIAKSAFEKKAFVKEWQTFIALTIILRVLAMCFSIFAGYFYFNQLFISILNVVFWSQVFAVLTLLFLEVMTALSLERFFKFALRLNLKTASPILLLALALFSVSFYSSTNGLALRQSKRVDNTEIITAQYNLKLQNLNNASKLQKSQIQEQINTIKSNPQGWTKGQRTTLLQNQLNKIDKYYSELKNTATSKKAALNQIETDFKKALAANNQEQKMESEKYYKIVSVIMILIFLINGLLMFFYSKVTAETNKELHSVEVIQDFSENISKETTSLIESNIQDVFNRYFLAIKSNFEQISPPEPQSIGFNLSGTKPDEKSPETRPGEVHTLRPLTPVNYGRATCPICKTGFVKNSHNHTFCSELCRINHWEFKTGKNLSKYKNLQK